MKVWQICVFIHINFGWLCNCVNHIQSNACRRFIMKSSLLRFTKSIYCPDLVQTRLGKIKTLGATVSVFALKQCQELRILLTFLHCKGNSCGARLPFFCPACCRRRGQSQGMKFGDGINWMDRAFWKWSIQRAQDKLQNGPPSSFFFVFQGWCAKTELLELVLCRTSPSTKKLQHRYCSICCRTQAHQTLSTSQVQCRNWMKLAS